MIRANTTTGICTAASGTITTKDSLTSSSPRLDKLSKELHRQCGVLGELDDLTYHLKLDLESLSSRDRLAVASVSSGGCAPLFKACRVGNLGVARYLIDVCRVDVDQKGYTKEGARVYHNTTPLWYAAVKGHRRLVEFLLSVGADVNAVTDTGSTPIRSACFSSRIDIVELLLKHGADAEIANCNGGTCLINSVQSAPLCRMLLQHGVNANVADLHGRTAVHYAVSMNKLEALQVLAEFNADFTTRTIQGETPLMLACREAKCNVFEFLVDQVRRVHSSSSSSSSAAALERELLDALLLMGASLYEVCSQDCTQYWASAVDVMSAAAASSAVLDDDDDKSSSSSSFLDLPLFRGRRIFRTTEEFEEMLMDSDAGAAQSLLIAQRVLGMNHPDVFGRLRLRGCEYCKFGRPVDAMWLWMELLAREMRENGILGQNCITVLAGYVCVLLAAQYWFEEKVPVDLVLDLLDMIIREIEPSRQLLSLHPQSTNQVVAFDDVLCCIPHLLHYVAETEEDHPRLVAICRQLGEMNSRTFVTGLSVLHSAVTTTRRFSIETVLTPEQYPSVGPTLPSLKLTHVLLKAGWNPDVVDKCFTTPLHSVLCAKYPGSVIPKDKIAKLLLDAGCQVDLVDARGRRAFEYLPPSEKRVLSLRNLAATAVGLLPNPKTRDELSGILPAELVPFVAQRTYRADEATLALAQFSNSATYFYFREDDGMCVLFA